MESCVGTVTADDNISSSVPQNQLLGIIRKFVYQLNILMAPSTVSNDPVSGWRRYYWSQWGLRCAARVYRSNRFCKVHLNYFVHVDGSPVFSWSLRTISFLLISGSFLPWSIAYFKVKWTKNTRQINMGSESKEIYKQRVVSNSRTSLTATLIHIIQWDRSSHDTCMYHYYLRVLCKNGVSRL